MHVLVPLVSRLLGATLISNIGGHYLTILNLMERPGALSYQLYPWILQIQLGFGGVICVLSGNQEVVTQDSYIVDQFRPSLESPLPISFVLCRSHGSPESTLFYTLFYH